MLKLFADKASVNKLRFALFNKVLETGRYKRLDNLATCYSATVT